jgi:5-(carboxyamino)imidazole ribonucleotide synthase
VAGYDDVGGALRLARYSDVVTYELEHVAVAVVDALDGVVPVRPGRLPLQVTQDRILERRFVQEAGAAVAPWREIRTTDDLRRAALELGLPLRVKATTGGYDGRSQIRVAEAADVDVALERLVRKAGAPLLAEAEMAFDMELSIIVARGLDGPSAAFPVARNTHDEGILVESVAPAPVAADVAERAADLGERLARTMGMIGTLTAELFLMPDGQLVVNELAPRVHNSGHWTIDGAATSQFEQHIRAICGLGLGSPAAVAPTAMVNLLGTGRTREARLASSGPGPIPRPGFGPGPVLADPAAHLHLYDKRLVFERRKMGHVTATGTSIEDALDRARAGAAHLCWADDPVGGGKESER